MKQTRMDMFRKILLTITIVTLSLAWGAAAVWADDDETSLSSLSISGPSTVNESSTANYTATARYSDGSTRTVTTRASWSENSDYASISGGVLTTRAVSSNRSLTITARYSYNGSSRSVQKTVTIANAGAQATLSGLTIAGPSTVGANSTGSYTATASFSNGTTQTVTTGTTWSETSSFSTISTGGVLTTTAPTSNQSVTVGGSYTSGGVTRTAGLPVTISAVSTQVTLSGLAINGPSTVGANSTGSYTATASFSNGSTQPVTTGMTWSENSTFSTISTGGVLTTTAPTTNQSVTVTGSYTSGGVTRTAGLPVTISAVPTQVTLSGLAINGPPTVASNSTGSYTATASFSNGSTQPVTTGMTWSENSTFSTISTGGVLTTTAPTTNQSVTVTGSYTSGTVTRTASLPVTISAGTTPPPPTGGAKSINSTSQNRATLPTGSVPEQPLTTLSGFQIFSVNDLGMHCGDLDHRVASILPPFNVLHAQVIQKGTSSVAPEKLTVTDVDVRYSAASNPKDPALANPTSAPVFKTNFWAPNPAQPSTSIAFDGYDPFYPPGILGAFPLAADMSLPVPDNAQLYPVSGAGVLTAEQQDMPGIAAPYAANAPQSFKRFDTDLPFFVNFPFGYRLANMNWFAADGIPVAPVDDFGRKNSYPLVRVQAVTKSTALTGRAGDVVASVDSVIPVSSEAICYTCHTSSVDGGRGAAACIPGIDANCNVGVGGSPRSNTPFVVARASDDPSTLPAEAKREWAADSNIIRLHDAKHGTSLQASQPVVCQTCHYTPALDLAHLGPLGPGDAAANGRNQKVHRTNSNVMHAFHGKFTDLLPNDMPPPNDSRRINPATGKPVINAFVTDKLNQTCYQCHPGKDTKCLRGAMFNGGMICNDCHGNMQQVGNDFSSNWPTAPFPAFDATKRIPWANEPMCQSCHTGDAMTNLRSDPNVIGSSDGIRLLRAYRSNDANAKPIVATNKRFAEEVSSNGNQVLFRLGKGHSGIACQSCHGSTHAEWPVLPETSASVANDNMAAIQLQGHSGTIMECTSCHTAGSLPNSLGGPHGMHPVGESRFVSGHSGLAGSNSNQCRACHGQNGEGTVLSKVPVNRTIGSRSFTKGEQVTCTKCHGNEL